MPKLQPTKSTSRALTSYSLTTPLMTLKVSGRLLIKTKANLLRMRPVQLKETI